MRRGVAERILMLKDMLEEDLATSTINVDVDAVVMRHVVSFYDWLVDHAEATEQDRKGHAQVREASAAPPPAPPGPRSRAGPLPSPPPSPPRPPALRAPPPRSNSWAASRRRRCWRRWSRPTT